MTDIAIRLNNLSKRYRLGAARGRHDTLRDPLAAGLRWNNRATEKTFADVV